MRRRCGLFVRLLFFCSCFRANTLNIVSASFHELQNLTSACSNFATFVSQLRRTLGLRASSSVHSCCLSRRPSAELMPIIGAQLLIYSAAMFTTSDGCGRRSLIRDHSSSLVAAVNHDRPTTIRDTDMHRNTGRSCVAIAPVITLNRCAEIRRAVRTAFLTPRPIHSSRSLIGHSIIHGQFRAASRPREHCSDG